MYLKYGRSWVFTADWKMPLATVNRDSAEIITFGRGLNDADKMNFSFREWFTIWVGQLNGFYKIMLAIDFVSIGYFLFFIVKSIAAVDAGTSGKTSFKRTEIFLIAVSTCGFFGWILSAPLVRYGIVYMFLLPTLAFGFYLSHSDVKWKKYAVSGALLVILLASLGKTIVKYEGVPGGLVIPADYMEPSSCETIELNPGVFIYYSTGGVQSGDDLFPCVPYRFSAEQVALRGETVQDGFRTK